MTCHINQRCLLLLPLLLAATACGPRGMTERTTHLTVELVDGSRVSGTGVIRSVPVRTRYAMIDVPIDQIATMARDKDAETIVVTTHDGDRLSGTTSLESIKLHAVFGSVSVPLEQMGRVRVMYVGQGPISPSDVLIDFGFDGHTWKVRGDHLDGLFGHDDGEPQQFRSNAYRFHKRFEFGCKVRSKWYQGILVRVNDVDYRCSVGHWKNRDTWFNGKRQPGKVADPSQWHSLKVACADGTMLWYYDDKVIGQTALPQHDGDDFALGIGIRGYQTSAQIKDVFVLTDYKLPDRVCGAY